MPLSPNRTLRAVVIPVFLLAIAFAPSTPAARADERSDKVDTLFAAWDTTRTPGAALAVVRDGRIVYERGYGMAKIEDGLAMTPAKVFDIGSVSKQFTASCVVLLAGEGRLSLDDDVRKWFPALPVYGRTITVRHLLHHTSGLRDYNALLELAGFRSDSDCPTVEEALEVVLRQKKTNFPPGEEYSYSNTGYFLLGQIVERVSGKSLNAFSQERIFGPLDMRHTLYQDDHTQIIPERATGYSRRGGGFRIDMSDWDETGDGNVYTTVEDLAKWDAAFYGGGPLSPAALETLQTTGTLNDGTKLTYACGLVIRPYKGLKTVEHGGAWAGFRAEILRFPEQRFTVICLANRGDANPTRLCEQIADIYLEGMLKAEEPAAKPAAPAEAAGPVTAAAGAPVTVSFSEMAGNYEEAKFGVWMTVKEKDGKPVLEVLGGDFPLTAAGPNRFVTGPPVDLVFEFCPAKGKAPAGATATVRGRDVYRMTKTPPPGALTEAALRELAGDYVSPELLDAKYTVAVEKGAPVLTSRTGPAALRAMAPDKFLADTLNLTFTRKGGRVTGFLLSVGRAAGIEFRKRVS